MFVSARRQRESAGQSGAIEYESVRGQARDFAGALEALRDVVLDALVDRAEVTGKHAILLAAQREEMVDEGIKPIAAREFDAGLADFVELQVEVRQQLRVSGIGSDGKGLGTRRHVGREPVKSRKRTQGNRVTRFETGFWMKLCHKRAIIRSLAESLHQGRIIGGIVGRS